HDNGQEHNHDRLEQGSHSGDGVINLFVVVIGNLEQHFGQSAGLFTDIDHADNHGRKDAGSFQRGGDGFTLFDALMHVIDRIADDDISGSFFDDSQRLQDGHAAADERAQCARKTGDGDFVYDGANNQHFQFELVP